MKRSLLVVVVLATIGSFLGGTAYAAPANDNFAQAKLIIGAPLDLPSESNIGATTEPGETTNFFYGASVWYSWTAPATSDFVVDLCSSSSSFNSFVSVSTGSDIAHLSEVGGNDDGCGIAGGPSKLAFFAKQGHVYKIAVYGVGFGPSESNFDLKIKLGSGGLYVTSASRAEGNKGLRKLVFTAVLVVRLGHAVRGHWYTKDCDFFACTGSSANADVDYKGSNANFTIPAHKRSTRFVIWMKGDRTVESNEQFQVLLSRVQGTPVGNGVGFGTILNDDEGA